MKNQIYISLVLFLAATGSAAAQSTLPAWEWDGGVSGTRDNLYEMDQDNWGHEGSSEGTRNSTWVLFGRVANNVSASWTCNRWDHDPRRIGFISTEDLYHDWAPGCNKKEGNKRFDAMYLGFIDISDPDNRSTRTRTNVVTITKDARVGINTTSPLAKLDILAGADNTGSNDPIAMAFQYRAGGFRHWIRTRHNGVSTYNSGNAFDFYLNSATTASASSAPGTGSTLSMSITAAGVGIGTSTPGSKLEVTATGSRTAAGSGIIMNGDGKSPAITSTLKVLNGDNSYSVYNGNFGVNQWGQDANSGYKYPFLNIETKQDIPIIMEIGAKPIMQIFQNQVLIGSDLSFPSTDAVAPYSGLNYTLGVRGRIVSAGFTCKDLSQWADYVFDDNYSLKPLDEVADYVAENKHLPDVPSAKEVMDKGIDVAEMLKIQMQKIEELTLYSIQQEQKLAAQQERVSKLQAATGLKK